MKFQATATLLGLLAFYSVQVIAQDSSAADTQVSVPTLTESVVASDVLPTPTESATDPDSIDEPSSVVDSDAPQPTDSGVLTGPDSSDDNDGSSTNESSTIAEPGNPQPTTTEPTDNGDCQDGQYQCTSESSPEFQWCVAGKWTQNSCAQGTVCKPIEGSIACDWADSEEGSEQPNGSNEEE